MRKLLWLAGLLALAGPAYAQYPPDESAFVVEMAARTGDLIKNDSTAFTDAVCSALGQKDPNWGRKVRRAGDWSSRNADAIAYRFGSDTNKALVDIVYSSSSPGGPPSPNARPAWQVYPAPTTGNGYWMKCPAPPAPPAAPATRDHRYGHDFDGDGMLDLAVYRPSNGTWYIMRSSTRTASVTTWGRSTDVPVPADYDGDGRADVAVFRPSEGLWRILRSSTGTGMSVYWGMSGDVPVPGDYDGDGKADVAVWRQSDGRWYWLRSSDNYSRATYRVVQWGRWGDVLTPADYDGDGKVDLAIWRPGEGRWYWLKSTANYARASYGTVAWGIHTLGDDPVPADYDGDGKADLAVWRPGPGMWYWLKSTDNYSLGTYGSRQWGGPGDRPAPADYDGDGKADFILFRQAAGTWYGLLTSTGNDVSVVWGKVGDKPL